jgi:hypothetical protein
MFDNIKRRFNILRIWCLFGFVLIMVVWANVGVLADTVAVVNGTVITRKDYNKELNTVVQQLKKRGASLDDRQMAELQSKVVEKLIDTELLYQESKKKGIRVGESAVDMEFKNFKQKFKNDETFNRNLSKMNVTVEMVKNKIHQSLAIRRFIEKHFTEKVSVDDKEIYQYFEQNMKANLKKKLIQDKINKAVGRYVGKLKQRSDIRRMTKQK